MKKINVTEAAIANRLDKRILSSVPVPAIAHSPNIFLIIPS